MHGPIVQPERHCLIIVVDNLLQNRLDALDVLEADDSDSSDTADSSKSALQHDEALLVHHIGSVEVGYGNGTPNT